MTALGFLFAAVIAQTLSMLSYGNDTQVAFALVGMAAVLLAGQL